MFTLRCLRRCCRYAYAATPLRMLYRCRFRHNVIERARGSRRSVIEQDELSVVDDTIRDEERVRRYDRSMRCARESARARVANRRDEYMLRLPPRPRRHITNRL